MMLVVFTLFAFVVAVLVGRGRLVMVPDVGHQVCKRAHHGTEVQARVGVHISISVNVRTRMLIGEHRGCRKKHRGNSRG